MDSKQRRELLKFIHELRDFKGRHTSLVSVYIPAGYDLNKILNHLSQEQGTATNIKDSTTRKNVIDALERMIQHLRLYTRTPEHGLAVFSGNIAEREGQQDLQVWSIEPPEPLKFRLYRCDKTFILDALSEMAEKKDTYGLVVMDRRDARIALLKGKSIIPLDKTSSAVPGKFKAGGQCCIKDTSVQLSDGSLPKIEIVHNPNIVSSVMIKNNLSIQESNITDKWNKKKNQIYKIVTKSPRLELQSSKDHVFFVVTSSGINEIPAKELKEGDFLIMPEKMDIKGRIQKINSKKYYNSFIINKKGQKLLIQKRLDKGLLQRQLAKKVNVTQTTISSYEIGKLNSNKTSIKKICDELNINFKDFLEKYTQPKGHQGSNIKLPKKIDEDFAQFIGYYIGDGSIETDRITFFEQNKEVALLYKNKFDKYFNITSSYKFRKSKNYHQLRFTSRPLVRLIKEEFPEIKKARNSEIPVRILQSPKKIIAFFLKGFFDAEGYCTFERGLALGINNKRLIHQIQLLLLRFSIICSIYEYDNKKNNYTNNHRFSIDITEKKSIKLFKKYIGFTSKQKYKRLDNLLKKKSDRSNVRQIIVSGSKIRKIIERAGYNLELFPKVNNFFRNERMMSKQTFKRSILAYVKDKKLHKQLSEIYEIPLLPVKISKIQKIKRTVEMVDISVKNQNFFANGILVHNSSQRFERLIEGAAKEFYKKVGEYMRVNFLENNKDIKGIIVGGPGRTKNELIDKGDITDQVKRKIIAVKDLSYTGEFGLQELVDKSQDVLSDEEIATEKGIMQKFFNLLSTKPKMVSYGLSETKKCLEMGAVDTLLLSEELDENTIEQFEKTANELGSNVEIISTETREGVQLRDMGKVAAVLRYEIDS
ncbi:helix-turn-helix domain-containing protein [Candidatus Woesearchaeota archaeon]|nr:helix-turn-helix domain-containing protein [Candidatus Woesearchaeota archaeon]